MGSFDIGAKLRQERLAQELAISDIARDTRIAPHFLEAIETADFAHLPGLVFTRNFVRQYALSLKLDPDLLLAELPKQDESTVQLPVPPSRARTSYYRHRTLHSAFSSLVPLTIAAGGLFAAYIHFNRAPHMLAAAENIRSAQVSQPREARRAQLLPVSLPVKVSMTASQAAWVQVTADGKAAFTGTLRSDETKEIEAADRVRILTGNAGALKVSVNGKTLDSLGPAGQIRTVTLTAEGPPLLSKAHGSSPPDPL